jgi:hypothetical protein
MGSMLVLNLIAAVAVVTALATVCGLAYLVGGGRLDAEVATTEPLPRYEADRRAA